MVYDTSQPSRIILDFLGVWHIYTKSILLSLVLAIAFPLTIVYFRWRQVIKNDYLLLSWLILIMGIIQFALFAEAGPRYTDANFEWGYNIALATVFLFSVVEFFLWRREVKISNCISNGLQVAKYLLFLHTISGIVYFLRILAGKSYF